MAMIEEAANTQAALQQRGVLAGLGPTASCDVDDLEVCGTHMG